MNVRRRKYKNKKTGETQAVATYTVRFRDHRETQRELPAFSNRRASMELGNRLDRLVQLRAAGCGPDTELTIWLESLPRRIAEKLVTWGMLDPERLAASRLLKQHLDDWKSHLLAKGNTEEHGKLLVARVLRTIDGCHFRFHSEISGSRIQQYLVDLRAKEGISAQTFNFYLQAIKQFCRWMVKDRRADNSPIAYLSGLNVRTDRRHDRRALTVDEVHRLLGTAESGPFRFGMTGAERALVYRLSLETGLRANEIRSLTRTSFNFDSKRPVVTVEAGYSKHRREDTLPLRLKTAAILEQRLACKMPDAPAFNMPTRTCRMMRFDLHAAGISYRDASGRYADFHALRHTFITNLARSGAHPSTAQALARHSTITCQAKVEMSAIWPQLECPPAWVGV